MDDPGPEIAMPKQGIQVIEYFAGVGRIAYMAERVGYQSVGYDLDYGKTCASKSGKRNPLDLNSNAGFVLAIRLILRSSFNNLIAIFAVCCSSWVPVNRGTGGRDLLVPEGDEGIPSVRRSNKLLARMLVLYSFNLFWKVTGGTPCLMVLPCPPSHACSGVATNAAEECNPHGLGDLCRRGDCDGEPPK